MLNAGDSLKETRNSYLNPDRYLTVGKIGVTALMAKGLRNLYLIQVGAALPTEAFNFKLNYIRPNGALVWRHLYHNNKLWHTLGVTYSPIQGRDFPLPIAGFGAKLSNEDQIQFTFPFSKKNLFCKSICISFFKTEFVLQINSHFLLQNRICSANQFAFTFSKQNLFCKSICISFFKT